MDDGVEGGDAGGGAGDDGDADAGVAPVEDLVDVGVAGAVRAAGGVIDAAEDDVAEKKIKNNE